MAMALTPFATARKAGKASGYCSNTILRNGKSQINLKNKKQLNDLVELENFVLEVFLSQKDICGFSGN